MFRLFGGGKQTGREVVHLSPDLIKIEGITQDLIVKRFDVIGYELDAAKDTLTVTFRYKQIEVINNKGEQS